MSRKQQTAVQARIKRMETAAERRSARQDLTIAAQRGGDYDTDGTELLQGEDFLSLWDREPAPSVR